MTQNFYRNAVFALSVICLLLAFVCGALLVELAPLKVRASLAVEQVKMFDWLLQGTNKPDVTATRIADSMEGVLQYYPTGTKQISGSRLDQLVEFARQAVLREMITHLRELTGKDLGDDPGPWIEAYAPDN